MDYYQNGDWQKGTVARREKTGVGDYRKTLNLMVNYLDY